ncbi:MAG: DUF3093 family protein [Micrococcales bacterium]|nr:DUF3093 family protein [Micrococcales bacterium]
MTYREVLRPPWWAYGVVTGLLALLCFTFAAVVTVPVALVVFVVLVVVGGLVVSRRRLVLSVDAERLHIGDEALPLSDIAAVTALDGPGVQAVAGPLADSRARLVLRNLATKEGVKIDLRSGDVPYWLVSSGHPQELAESLSGPGI